VITGDKTFLEWWENNHSDFIALLFDIDGTLVSGKRLMPGADKMMQWIRKNNFPFYLLTNDGNHSTEEKSALMRKVGLDITPDEIVSCSMALNSYVEQNALTGSKFFVMGDLGKPCYAEKAGLKVTRNTKELGECAGVIVGEGIYDWQRTINAVLNAFIKDRSLKIVIPNPDSYWPNGKSGEIGIGAGGKARFMQMILSEMGIELNPVYLGKPYRAIYEYAFSLLKKRFNLPDDTPHKKVAMLGDSLKSDILGANICGFKSVLLLTGITNTDQVRVADGNMSPDYVFKSLGT